jgi:hypothetical protein
MHQGHLHAARGIYPTVTGQQRHHAHAVHVVCSSNNNNTVWRQRLQKINLTGNHFGRVVYMIVLCLLLCARAEVAPVCWGHALMSVKQACVGRWLPCITAAGFSCYSCSTYLLCSLAGAHCSEPTLSVLWSAGQDDRVRKLLSMESSHCVPPQLLTPSGWLAASGSQ